MQEDEMSRQAHEGPQWAPRLPRNKIARLYVTDARGIVDEELIDEVGYGLLLRCESILTATEASRGTAPCPKCGHIIHHQKGGTGILRCGSCPWEIPWKVYRNSYQGKQLIAGGMEPFFKDYVEAFPKARTPQEKMLLIDLLIHRFHHEMKGTPKRIGAVNLIQGKMRDVIAFLDGLTYSEHSTPGVRANLLSWRNKAGGQRG